MSAEANAFFDDEVELGMTRKSACTLSATQTVAPFFVNFAAANASMWNADVQTQTKSYDNSKNIILQ